jgi:ribosomal protein S16
MIGYYNPLTEPPTVKLKEDRVKRWIGVGAKTSAVVKSLVKKQLPGLIEERESHQRKKIQEQRRARKKRNHARAA